MSDLKLKRVRQGGKDCLALSTDLAVITIPIERAADLATAVAEFAPARPTTGTIR